MADVQANPQHRLPVAHLDITSANTGISQFLRAPLLSLSDPSMLHSHLGQLLKPSVEQSFLAAERDARSAAYLLWVVVHPILLASELNDIMQNKVVAIKREGKQTFSSLAEGQQGALALAFSPLVFEKKTVFFQTMFFIVKKKLFFFQGLVFFQFFFQKIFKCI